MHFKWNGPLWPVLTFLILTPCVVSAADVVEFLTGARVSGTVTRIDKDARQISFKAVIGGKSYTRVYSYNKIHAVLYQGKRYVLNELPAGVKPRSPAGGSSVSPSSTSGGIRARIAQEGASNPEWLAATQVNYPNTLDLNWPMPAPKGWNNQKNMGQFIWDVVNPNPRRWRSGIKLMYQLLDRTSTDPGFKTRVMKSLASMYFRFFQDYSRAAYWWQQAGVKKGDAESVQLAECYWRLGNKPMAEELINYRILRPSMIKLLGDMKEPDKAISLSQRYVKVGGTPHSAYLHCGDACRLAGRYEQAIRFYEMVLNEPLPEKKGRAENQQKRARANMLAVQLFEQLDVSKVADGSYRSASRGYAGQVEVEVTVGGGEIQSVKIVRHQEKQFYSALEDTPAQIIALQGVKGVDATSRATITAEAIINASAKALSSGQQ